MAARSYLYVPADQPEKLAGADRRGADALILDLEDGVAPANKTRARTAAEAWLAARPVEATAEIWVRVNNDPALFNDDLGAVISSAAKGIWLPKASPETVGAANGLLDAVEQPGPTRESIAIVPLIETASALLCLPEIARQPRVSHLGVGLADLGADLGLVASNDDALWVPILLQLVVASAAATIGPPTAPTSTSFRDLEGFRTSSAWLRRMGFRSRTAIHPGQIPVIHDVFTPSIDEVNQARRIVELFEAAVSEGTGVLAIEGLVVDEAVVRAARTTLELAAPFRDDGTPQSGAG